MELGRSLEVDATLEYRRTEDAEERRVGVGVGERRFEDGGEVTRVTEEFRYTEDTLRQMELESKKTGAFRETEKAKDSRFMKLDHGDITPKQRDAEMEIEYVDGQCGEVSSTSQVRSGDARRDAEERSVARPRTKEGRKEGDRTLSGRTPKTWSPDLFSVDSVSAYHMAKTARTAKKRGTSCCPEELLMEAEMEIECTKPNKEDEH